MDFELKSLVDTLNPQCRKSLEAAAGLCVSQTNYNVEIEHLVLKMVEMPGTDVAQILRRFDIDSSQAVRELTFAVDLLKRGNSGTPALSPHISELIREGWLISSLHLRGGNVRTGALLLALLDTPTLRGLLADSAPALMRIQRDELRREIRDIIAGSVEDSTATAPAVTGTKNGAATTGKTEALDLYTHDLTA
ncbi:MAG: type VI secretion system ATPase TssH, partial [Candidatus Kapaibacterium sp.]